MTGPPVPIDPTSSEIGRFTIGSSPIGDITLFNPWSTIVSQYSNSPIMDAIIVSFGEAMDQTANMANVYDMIWNVATAQGYGLDVIGRIVGVARTATFATDDDFRDLITAKMLSNVSDGSILSLNAILMVLFGSAGNVFVVDTGGMAMAVECNTGPDTARRLSLLSGILPYPAGVTVTVTLVIP